LPIVIAADGLYPNEPFMQLCHDHECNFILTLKDGNLPDLQEEIALQTASNLHHAKLDRCSLLCPPEQQYRWINNLSHNDIDIHWLECRPFQTPADKENKPATRHVFITDLEVNEQNADKLCAAGRARWKIENEGFNTQKNGGYELAHKYSRVSFVATQNYCLCLQIAHLINQFAERSATVAKLVKNKFTLRHIWEKILRPALALRLLDGAEVQALQNRASQIRVYT